MSINEKYGLIKFFNENEFLKKYLPIFLIQGEIENLASPISIKEYKSVIEIFLTKKMIALDNFTDGSSKIFQK